MMMTMVPSKSQMSIIVIVSMLSLVSSQDYCENLNPISEIVLHMSSRLPAVIGGDSNLAFSPFSISVALAMLYIGTQGRTKQEIKNALNYNVLGNGLLDKEISEGFYGIIHSLRADYVDSVTVSNSVFVQDGLSVSARYLEKLIKYFDSQVMYANFSADSAGAMESINNYVANRTNGQIERILNDPLDPLTVMILMNVVYFKGIWKHPFLKDRTRISSFNMLDGTVKYVPFMFLQRDFYYVQDPDNNISYLELDYSNSNISMVLAMSDTPQILPNVSSIRDIICRFKPLMEMRNVQLALPKFKMEFSREMSKDMMVMGIRELFSERADMRGIRDENDLHVSLIVHKSIIEVDEEGSEASAVSGVGIYGRVKNRKTVKFYADHPFLFYIIDKRLDLVIFAGRVLDPTVSVKI